MHRWLIKPCHGAAHLIRAIVHGDLLCSLCTDTKAHERHGYARIPAMRRQELPCGVALKPLFTFTKLLDVRFDHADTADVLAAFRARPADAAFAYVVTINADHFVRLDTAGPDLRADYAAAWMSVCDSRIIRLLAGWRGYSLDVVPGSDLTQALFDQLDAADSVAIIGGDGPTIATLRARYPSLTLFHHNPPMGFIRNPSAVTEAVEFVCRHPARYVLLCVGSPQQEILAARIAASGRACGIGLCVGASVEFIAGTRRRAPLWVQKAHLEWLHRLLQEPGRLWRRYLLGAAPLLRMFLRVPKSGTTAGS